MRSTPSSHTFNAPFLHTISAKAALMHYHCAYAVPIHFLLIQRIHLKSLQYTDNIAKIIKLTQP